MSRPIPPPQRSRTRTALLGLAAVSLAASVAIASTASAAPGNGGGKGPKGDKGNVLVDLQLLAFNDYHGHVEASAAGTIEGLGEAGGGQYLATKLNELRVGQANSLTVAAGDLIGGSPFFSGLFHDEPSVESLNAMDLDVSSVGNHEFDEGVTELLRMQDGGCHPSDGCYFDEPYAGADFQWLAANVTNASGETPLPPYWIEKVGGIKVGFIGMTLEATDTLVSADGIQGWNFLDEAETANALVPVLRDQGVRAIIVLLHEGGIPDPIEVDGCKNISGPIVQINAALDPQIDAMVTGHTHLPYNCVLEGRFVTSAYSYGRVVTEMNLVLDKRTRDVRRDLSTVTNHAVVRAELAADPAVTAVIDKWAPLAEDANSTIVGSVTADINRGGVPTGANRGVESPAGNLVADSLNWSASAAGSQIGLMNPGGVRADLKYAPSGSEAPGQVTFGEAFNVLPFGSTVITFPMTGAQLQSVLKEQCQPLGASRPILHLGVSAGFTYDLSTTVSAGSCTSVTVSNMKLNGVAIDLASTYRVTVPSFLATGEGDNFTTFGQIPDSAKTDSGLDLLAFANYLGTFSPVAPPSTDRVNELP